ncbi:MAG: HIT domain-containing protein [Verrucomicrobia bacterium]|nr:HIT domain-containing protein [Verrucomicrobiota bacterium]MDA1339965.1 HIT domain-containing protein [Verrucomicrobiota bacterium]
MMEHLWAPWRNRYVTGEEKPSEDLFRRLANSSDDTADLILARTKASFAVLNRYPYNLGHVLVCPYREVDDLASLSTQESADLWTLVNRMTDALRRAMKPEGFNIGINLGTAAGAGVPKHLHVHVVPRWTNDSNFLTTIGTTRIHPGDLPTVYTKLVEALAA